MRLGVEPLEDRLAPATRVWAGLGLDNNWSNSANWVGNVLPTANDDLVFPANTPRLVNVNDLPYIYNSITFSGANYLITGSALGVRGPGIVQTVAGTTTFELVTFFIGPDIRPISVAAGGTLTMTGRLTGPGGFAKSGGGTLVLAGQFANDYASVTTIQEGTLLLRTPAGTVAVPGELVVGDGTGSPESDVLRVTAPGQVAPASLTVNSSGLLALEGPPLTATGLTLNGGHVDTGTSTLTLTGDISANPSGTPAILRGKFDLGTVPRTIRVADGPAAEDLVINGTLLLDGALTKTGTGRLVLEAANSLASTVTVDAGVLTVRNAEALGTTTAGTVVAAGAALELQGGTNVGVEPLTLTGATGDSSALRGVGGNNSWAGVIILLSDAGFLVSAGQLDLTSAIRATGGAWAVTKTGEGTLAFTGSVANTYSGTTTVSEGTLLLGKSAGVAAVTGSLVVGDAGNLARTGVVRLQARDQIVDASAILLVGNGALDLNGFAETIGPLTFTGGKVATGTGTLTLGGDVTVNATQAPAALAGNLALGAATTRALAIARGSGSEDLLLSAVVSGSGGLNKLGQGILRMTGTNSYTGATTVAAGTLLVDGSLVGNLTVAAGAVFGGDGTVADANVSGTLAPGKGTGVLRVRNLSLTPNATFRAELNGTDAGLAYDQLAVSGTLDLAGASLSASLGFRSVGSARFLVLNNTSSRPITGTFRGLVEGARLTIDGRPFVISYVGGDGDDVTLTDASIPCTVVFTTPLGTARFGELLSFGVTVRPASGSSVPTGRVTVREGTTTRITSSLNRGSVQTFDRTLSVGRYVLTADYEGDDTFSPCSSTPITLTVAKGLTSLRLAATPNPARGDQTVTLTAALAERFEGTGRPTGSLTFREGTTVLGTASFTNAGQAQVPVTGLSPGVHVFTVSYDGDGNFEAGTTTVNVTITSARRPEERFVTQLYADLLRRNVDPQGLAAWTTALSRGLTRGQVVQAIQGSQEYFSLVVQDQYQRFLRRRADTSGLTAFVGFLARGGTVEQLQAILVGSPEYYQGQGGGTNEGWVEATYRDGLRRATDAPGRAAQLAGLASGVSRQRVAEIIFGSREYRSQIVNDLYQRYLKRTAETGGLEAFVAELNRGARLEQLAAAVAGSVEYFGKA